MPWLPAERPPRLSSITHQQINFRRAIELFVRLYIISIFESDSAKGALAKLTHGVRLAGRHHVVFGLRLLQHQVHGAHIVGGVAPVALRVRIAET